MYRLLVTNSTPHADIKHIGTFLDRNFMLLGTLDAESIVTAYNKISNVLRTLPHKEQRITLAAKTKFILCSKAQYKSEFGDGRAISIANEIYLPPSFTKDSIRHEIGHLMERAALREHPALRDRSFFNTGYMSDKSLTSLSVSWKKAIDQEMSSSPHKTGFWVFKQHTDTLYEGDESTIQYLKSSNGDIHSEAFAEISRKFFALYEVHTGQDEVINEILSAAYPTLWGIYRDDIRPEIFKVESEKIERYFTNYSGSLMHGNRYIETCTHRKGIQSFGEVKNNLEGFDNNHSPNKLDIDDLRPA